MDELEITINGQKAVVSKTMITEDAGTWLAVMPGSSEQFLSTQLRDQIEAMLKARGIRAIVFPVLLSFAKVEIQHDERSA